MRKQHTCKRSKAALGGLRLAAHSLSACKVASWAVRPGCVVVPWKEGMGRAAPGRGGSVSCARTSYTGQAGCQLLPEALQSQLSKPLAWLTPCAHSLLRGPWQPYLLWQRLQLGLCGPGKALISLQSAQLLVQIRVVPS